MRTLYAVRGSSKKGDWVANTVWVSKDFEVTMMYKYKTGSLPALQTGIVVTMDFDEFVALFGIPLGQGEYTEIEVSEA